MKLSRNQTSVAGDTVTASLSYSDPTKVSLHAFRHFPGLKNDMGGHGVFLRSWCYGMVFPSQEAAWQFAFEHGYIQAKAQEWCPHCRTLHRSEPIKLLSGYKVIPRRGYFKLFDCAWWRKGCKKA